MGTWTRILGVILLLALSSSFCTSAAGQTQKARTEFDLIENLSDQWLVYDNVYQSYVPYLQDRYPVQYTLNLVLDPAKYRSYRLLLEAEQPCYLFVQSKLVRLIGAQERVSLDLDSIQNLAKSQTLLLTLYNPEGHAVAPLAQVVFPHVQHVQVATVTAKDELEAKLRTKNTFTNFLIVAAVFVLGLYAFLWNYHPKAFSQYFNLRFMVPGALREDVPLINKPLSGSSLLFVLAHSFLLSLFYITVQQSSDKLFANILVVDATGQFWPVVQYFLMMSGLIFALLLGKYLLIQAVGSVFKLSGVTHVHFYEYLLFSRVFYTVVVFLQFALFLVAPVWVSVIAEVVIWIVLLFNIVRIVIINSVLSRLTSAKNLYLFSYLCTTELIPLLIGIKILIK
ncbi:MAG: hypothetical protein AVDCRST_MAG56-4114 [uncultured Cytophagales bacterium]|uniref:DUF4271 domain-containing protein n=1 Tax=uncultured Cytophagales bacterium TaxID=158755 RepID=A0A6J4JRV3_9SPHI|nr:MAG: hypothetical protein AVDCRST_MAG56-4114 [uncultured Cytophagales bacterium]